MSKRQCLFCSGRADSKEHLWPRWILDRQPHEDPFQHTMGTGPTKQISSPITVRCVCDRCNNGWMSQLENQIKPLVGSLMADISLTLNRDQQNILAIWGLKTAMVMDATKGKETTRCYQRKDRSNLKDQSVIPRMTMVWLGRFEGTGLVRRAPIFGQIRGRAFRTREDVRLRSWWGTWSFRC